MVLGIIGLAALGCGELPAAPDPDALAFLASRGEVFTAGPAPRDIADWRDAMSAFQPGSAVELAVPRDDPLRRPVEGVHVRWRSGRRTNSVGLDRRFRFDSVGQRMPEMDHRGTGNSDGRPRASRRAALVLAMI